MLELGCDHPGEIGDLCRIIRPHIGILTNISPTQLQYFGSVEHLAEELGTLLTCLPEDGMAFVHADDEHVGEVSRDVRQGRRDKLRPYITAPIFPLS